MTRQQATTTDPVELVDTLDADAIAARLDDLDRQSSALRVLLRAARARERRSAHPTSSRGRFVALSSTARAASTASIASRKALA